MPENRTKTGQFARGRSGNPGGRPRKTQAQRDALEAIHSLAPTAAQTLERMLTDEAASYAVKLKAAEIVLDRTYGKASQTVDVTGGLSADAKAEIDKLLAECMVDV